MTLDATNDPEALSWVPAANRPGGDFPVQNLPLAVFRRRGSGEAFRGGIAIGDQVLDLGLLARAGEFDHETAAAVTAGSRPSLNDLMQLGPAAWVALRRAVFEGLREGSKRRRMFEHCLVPQSLAEYALPAHIGDFTDFYSSIHHATAVGRLFRPDNPLLPNYKWLPIGYHGRSSSIGVSGQAFHRPWGQRLEPGHSEPEVVPSARLDYELELGVFLGSGNPLGTRIALEAAESHIFGLCLLNDWSARDIQAWEYQPLGPFLAKNFATTISPWIVSLQALEPFRVSHARSPGDPELPAYLTSARNDACGAFDIRLSVALETQAMRERGETPQQLSCTSFRHSYWTVAQLVAHHTVNGCNLRPGDLLGTGTQSGPRPEEAGSMLELSGGGKHPIAIGAAERRTFLEDGDAVTLSGWCEAPGAARIGFGEARGTVLPAQPPL
ncbi:MAG TPA: fumarylacetoacetase [Steroidobacteraceae bacterium]|jgi:fumarylacetoacetase|nr:fumarylacetoacetase [Steroidobacteraceae bacterium]